MIFAHTLMILSARTRSLTHARAITPQKKQTANQKAVAASKGHYLLQAAMAGYTAEVSALVDGGADLAAVDYSKRMTALHYAAMNGGDKIVEVLLTTAVNVEARDYRGQTALHCAGGERVFRLLLAAGADVVAKSNDGVTALHFAAKRESLHPCVAELLELGADVSAADKDGDTALHCAIKAWAHDAARRLEVVRLLVQAGADLAANNKWGTPLHAAAHMLCFLRACKPTVSLSA